MNTSVTDSSTTAVTTASESLPSQLLSSISSATTPVEVMASPPPTSDELDPDDEELGDAQMVPDGAKDVEKISSLRYIRMFISGKLSFSNGSKQYPFDFEDLTDYGPIGDGAYGRVNKMLHRETGRWMAVKKVRIISGKTDEGERNRSIKRIKQEIAAFRSASDCVQIVRFYGLTFHEVNSDSDLALWISVFQGDCLVCLELMDISLERLYHIVHKRTPGVFDERILGHVAVSILKALNHLKNENKIIHRDVKPSNILLNLSGMIKLCDFGISGYLVNSVAITREAGCRPYMAPERLLTNATYDIRSDVWSLGLTLVKIHQEVAIGEFPYPRFNENELFYQLQQVVYGDPPIMGPSDVYSIRTIQFINSWLLIQQYYFLVKETTLRPDYKKLMSTEYFNYYDQLLDGTPSYIASYVQAALDDEQKEQDSTVEDNTAVNKMQS
ncbi:unnamed protein product [Anisakis simplex]|uniref:mitogen-activated protein kinase kinase n=1 Tax=Anisakis simplex TaxID=6269 RepID=A0A0M3JT11_ANISI|nr:unnamed protein product [Anisakis simplex]